GKLEPTRRLSKRAGTAERDSRAEVLARRFDGPGLAGGARGPDLEQNADVAGVSGQELAGDFRGAVGQAVAPPVAASPREAAEFAGSVTAKRDGAFGRRAQCRARGDLGGGGHYLRAGVLGPVEPAGRTRHGQARTAVAAWSVAGCPRQGGQCTGADCRVRVL